VSDARNRRSGRRSEDRPDEKIRGAVRRTDSAPELVATAKFIRRLLLSGVGAGDELPRRGRVARLMSEFQPDRPSVTHQLGLGALQAWQALSEAQRRRSGKADVAILFTDLVGFSSWALEAGDEPALELLDRVATIEEEAVAENQGMVVKRLGDGTMAVFGEVGQAVQAALDAQRRLGKIKVKGHTPDLRAGVHLGRPRKVRGGDFLGVDVNVAARVGDAARGGQVLVSDAGREALDGSDFRFGRKRLLKAAGAPEDLSVYPVRSGSTPPGSSAKRSRK
jgi:adenylate cyclase